MFNLPSTPRRWQSYRAGSLLTRCSCCWLRRPHRPPRTYGTVPLPPGPARPRPKPARRACDHSAETETYSQWLEQKQRESPSWSEGRGWSWMPRQLGWQFELRPEHLRKCWVSPVATINLQNKKKGKVMSTLGVKSVGPVSKSLLVQIPERTRWKTWHLNPNCSCKSFWIRASTKMYSLSFTCSSLLFMILLCGQSWSTSWDWRTYIVVSVIRAVVYYLGVVSGIPSTHLQVPSVTKSVRPIQTLLLRLKIIFCFWKR